MDAVIDWKSAIKADVDWQKVLTEVSEAMRIACKLCNVPRDEEYISAAMRKAFYAIDRFNPDNTQYDVYSFIRYSCVRRIIELIRLESYRRARYKRMGEGYDAPEKRTLYELLEELRETDPVIAQNIESVGRTGRKTYKSRKQWQISKMRRDRLKKEHGTQAETKG